MSNKMLELRQRRAAIIEQAQALVSAAEAEDRDFTEDEAADYDGLLAEAEGLRKRIERAETTGSLVDELDKPARGMSVPSQLKLGRGDGEAKALAHFFRTGDAGAVSHLVSPDERGRPSVSMSVPTAAQMKRTQMQAAVVDSTMNITTAADGGNIVPTGFVQDIALRKNEMMLAERLGLRRVPGKGTTVNYPIDDADPEEFATTAEQDDAHAQNYERDAGATGLKAFTLVKKTRKIELTEELLDDNDIDLNAYISDKIGRQTAGTHNAMLVAEIAANGTSLKTFGSNSAIADGEPEDIIYNDTLAYYLDDDGNSIAWVTRPTTFGTIASISGNARIYAETPAGSRARRELLGYPAHYSNKVAAVATTAKSLLFGNWYYVGYREAPELRFIMDPYSVDGLVILKYSFRAVYGVLQAGAIGYGEHPV